MSENRVSATLSAEDVKAVLTAIETIKTKMPFLLSLSPEESKSLFRMGDKSRAFVTKALELASQNPDLLPRSFDLDEMRQDLELFETLYPITVALVQLSELVNDTAAIAGSEAYTAARLIYSYAKVNNLSQGLDPLIEDLGKLFRRSKSAKPSIPSSNLS